MIIDTLACKGCGKCAPYCPVGAIRVYEKDKEKRIPAYGEIDRDECVECAVCYRAGVCPSNAFVDEKLEWPRVLRRAFSDPIYVHKGTDVPGRGTEEMKTNDVTGRFADGYIGIGLEFGRPGVGTRLRETEKAIKKLLAIGVQLEPLNPLTQLIEDMSTGELRRDVLDEKVLSAIVECIVPIEQVPAILAAVKEVATEIDTVLSLDIISKVAPDGTMPAIAVMEDAGLPRSPNAKVNVGLGRP